MHATEFGKGEGTHKWIVHLACLDHSETFIIRIIISILYTRKVVMKNFYLLKLGLPQHSLKSVSFIIQYIHSIKTCLVSHLSLSQDLITRADRHERLQAH